MFPTDRLNPEDPDAMQAARKEMGEDDQNKMSLLSGCTYGSSFVGMVHVLKNESTKSSQVRLTKGVARCGWKKGVARCG